MNVCADACSDSTMVLRSRGLFGTEYLFNESCMWRIQVDEDQVKISAILYFSFSLQSNSQYNEKDIYYIYRLCYRGILSQCRV